MKAGELVWEILADIKGVAKGLDDSEAELTQKGVEVGEKVGGGMAEGAASAFQSEHETIGRAFDRAFASVGPLFGATVKELFQGVGLEAEHQLKLGLQHGLGLDSRTATIVSATAADIGGLLTKPIEAAIIGQAQNLGDRLAWAVANSGLVELVTPVMAAAGTALGAVLDAAIAAAPLLLPAVLIAAIGAAIVAVVNDPSLVGKAVDIGVSIARGIVDGVIGLVGGAIGLGVQLATAVVNAVLNLARGVRDLEQAAIDVGVGIVRSILEGVLGLAGGALSIAAQLLGAIAQAVTGVPSGIFAQVVEIGAGIVRGIIDGILGVGRGAVGLAQQLVRTITDVIAGLPEFVISIAVKLNLTQMGLQIQELLGFLPPGFADAVGRAQAIGQAQPDKQPTSHERGAWDTSGGLAVLHPHEMVLPAAAADTFRALSNPTTGTAAIGAASNVAVKQTVIVDIGTELARLFGTDRFLRHVDRGLAELPGG